MVTPRASRVERGERARARRRACALGLGCLLGLSSAHALADEPTNDGESSRESAPGFEWNVGLVAGMTGTGEGRELWQHTRFGGGLRADALFGRERSASTGYGPYASVTTAGFDDARIGAGASVLAPVLEDFPLVLSLGPMVRVAEGPARVGAETWLFWGVRSFNFHDSYNLSNGLLLGAQTTFEGTPDNAIWVTAQVDAIWPLFPVALLLGFFEAN